VRKTRAPAQKDRAANSSRGWNEAEHDALAPHFRLLELCGGNRPVESGAQLLGRLQRQLDPRPRTGVEVNMPTVCGQSGEEAFWAYRASRMAGFGGGQ
jgi:hypothetical protein